MNLTDVLGLDSARARSVARARRARWLQPLVLLLVDLATTNAAFYLAYRLRYVYEVGGDVTGEVFVEYSAYLVPQALFVALCLLWHQLGRGYSLPRGTSLAAEAMAVFHSTGIATLVVFALTSAVRYPAESRLVYIYAWLLAVALGITGRLLVRLFRMRLAHAGYGTERVVVVGSNRLARMVMQMLAQEAQLGYRVMGFVDDSATTDFGRFSALGSIRTLPRLIEQLELDRVIVALPAAQHSDILWVLDHCQRGSVSVALVPDLFELRLSHVSLDTVAGIPLFGVTEVAISGWNLLIKRAADVAGSALLLLLLSPLFLLLGVLIKLDSSGPVFFRQTRLGKNGTPFTCYKFRSMVVDAEARLAELREQNEADGPLFKKRDDPRVTRVGKLIRRASIDELPQLWNVLRGEMSLVGPRPPIPAEVEEYEDWHRKRLEVVPGITGLWQVNGRSKLSFDEMVMLDLFYIENWSLSLDLQILLRTIPAVFRGDGAF